MRGENRAPKQQGRQRAKQNWHTERAAATQPHRPIHPKSTTKPSISAGQAQSIMVRPGYPPPWGSCSIQASQSRETPTQTTPASTPSPPSPPTKEPKPPACGRLPPAPAHSASPAAHAGAAGGIRRTCRAQSEAGGRQQHRARAAMRCRHAAAGALLHGAQAPCSAPPLCHRVAPGASPGPQGSLQTLLVSAWQQALLLQRLEPGSAATWPPQDGPARCYPARETPHCTSHCREAAAQDWLGE